jgi:hypothetical protein
MSSPALAHPTAATPSSHVWNLLTGTGLKWLAIVTMLVDHTAAVLVYGHYLELRAAWGSDAALWYDAYLWMRRIGRISFPLFCFVLVEGFTHTHSRPKYALRLLAFALVSEVPYDLALHDEVSFVSQLNVMFTLLLAFVALWVADALGTALKLPSWGTVGLTVVTVAGAALLAQGPVDVSYHAYGIVLVGVLYLARKHRLLQFALGCAASAWYCVDHGSWLQMWSVVGLACIAPYNGQRGRGLKYFFYVFYPAHLLILWALGLWLL